MIHPMVTELRQVRESFGLSAGHAGRRAGLGKNTVGQWERGERSPGLAEISIYATSLGYAVALAPITRPEAA